MAPDNRPRSHKPPHPYLSGNFAPIQRTLPLTPCTYTGTIPPDLAGGQYVRNGGNPVSNGDLGRDAHWFDGDGMLSGVLFRRVTTMTGREGDGEAVGEKTVIQPEFANQYLLTDVYCYARGGHRDQGGEGVDCSELSATGRGVKRPVLASITTLVNPAASLGAVLWAVLRTMILVALSWLCGDRYPIRKISVANTGVLFHDGRALATCESGPPMGFALPGLETVGWFDGRGAENEEDMADHLAEQEQQKQQRPRPLTRITGPGFGGGGLGLLSFMKEWTTPHPRVDPVTKELIAFHSVFISPFVFYSIVPPSSPGPAGSERLSTTSRLLNMPVPGVSAPKMMHDFGVSREHTVIMDLPLTLDPRNLARGQPVLSYDPCGLSRFGVFPRYHPDMVKWFETKPCVIFHTANCWTSPTLPSHDTRDGGSLHSEEKGWQGVEQSVHLLACRLTSASLVFSAGNLPTPEVPPVLPEYAEEEQCRLYYYKFPLAASSPRSSSRHAPYHDGHDDAPGQEWKAEEKEEKAEDDGKAAAEENRIRHQWALSAIPFEFPTINLATCMQAARYVYGCTTGSSSSYTAALGKAAKIDYLAKIDAETLIARGRAQPPEPVRGCVDNRTVAEVTAQAGGTRYDDDPIRLFRMPRGWYAQEPRFVARRGAAGRSRHHQEGEEDDGWLLTFVFDEAQTDGPTGECRADAASELWVINAAGMREVVARVRLPQRVPYGLHGAWFAEEEIQAQRAYARYRVVPDEDSGSLDRDGDGAGRKLIGVGRRWPPICMSWARRDVDFWL